MFSKVTARIGKTAATGLIVATLGLGLVGGTGSAYARDNAGHSGAMCTYKGVDYSEGSMVRQDDGNLYKCVDGAWVWQCVCPTPKGQQIRNVAPAGNLQFHQFQLAR
jgi:hypothetical protein